MEYTRAGSWSYPHRVDQTGEALPGTNTLAYFAPLSGTNAKTFYNFDTKWQGYKTFFVIHDDKNKLERWSPTSLSCLVQYFRLGPRVYPRWSTLGQANGANVIKL